MRKNIFRKWKARRSEARAFNAGIGIIRDTAVHEAAHAVVAEFLGIRVWRVSVGVTVEHFSKNRIAGRKGETEYIDKKFPATEALNMAAAYCAGREADRLLSNRTEQEIEESCKSDMGAVRRLVGQFISPPPEQFIRQAVEIGTSKAREILETECAKAAVNDLADYLMAERTISGDRVREIIGRHSQERAA